MHWFTAAGLIAWSLVSGPAASAAESCEKHGTAVEFVSTPSVAATRAKAEQKLVFVLHVSGHFEDPAFT
jgi:hypothetical protein